MRIILRKFSCRLLLLLLLAGLPALASAEPYETIINNGSPDNRVDIAVVGDGYTGSEMNKYYNNVQAFVQAMFAQDPYLEYQRYFNVHRIDVISSQSGADHPERNSFVNTAFDAAYNCGGTQRLICVNYTKVDNVILGTLAPTQYDIKIVIVNDSEYGGSGGYAAVASTNFQSAEIVLHELGHSFGLLADEYGGSSCGGSASAPNVTTSTDRSLIKWNYWIDPATPVPTFSTTPGVPGLYQGALYCDSGYYRPTYDSKMRSLNRPFEQINTEQLIKRIYSVVSPIDGSSPIGSLLSLDQGQDLSFAITKPLPLTHTLEVVWYVDGQPQANDDSFLFQSTGLNDGTHTVDVLVKDKTALVRRDPEQLLSHTRHWDVTVKSAPTPTPTPTPSPSTPPVLLTEDKTSQVIALDSVTMLRSPLPILNANNLSLDQHTRIIVFATNADWSASDPISLVTAQATKAPQTIPLQVEYVCKVPNFDWLTAIYIRLPDELANSGEVSLVITVRGLASNSVTLSIKSPP